MSAVLEFLSLCWPYLVAGGVGGFVAHELDTIPYHRLQAADASYRAQVAEQDAKAQATAREALQDEIDRRLATETTNAKIVSEIASERDSAVSDRDVAQRLLAAAQTRPPAAGHPVPAGGPQPGLAPAALAPGDRPTPDLPGLTAGAITECRDAIERLAALQLEIQPQLRTP